MSISPDAKHTADSPIRHSGLVRLSDVIPSITGVAAGLIVELTYRGFHPLGARWNALFWGLAVFCLGLGFAYFIFARRHDRQLDSLRDDYAALHSRADALLVRVREARLHPESGE